LQPGDYVAVFDPSGVQCGECVVHTSGSYGLLPCDGDDPNTPEDEGAVSGDEIRLFIEDAIVGTGVWSGPGQLQEVPILGDPIGPLEQLYLPLILTAGSVEAQP
jgi:hypothetical protein